MYINDLILYVVFCTFYFKLSVFFKNPNLFVYVDPVLLTATLNSII